MSTYTNLNAELYMPVDGAINIRADKQAARAYHLEEINPHTRFFHSLDEKTRYMLDQGLWSRDTVEMYDFEKFKSLFKRAYSHKFRFQTLLGALKFYQGYALKEVNKNDDGIYTTTYLERFEDRVVMTAIHLSQGDYRQAQDLVDVIIDGRFQPATPTFLNAGRAKGGEMVSCFEGSTPVLAEQGEVPIKEIRIGDKVFGHDGKVHEVEAVHSHKATATVEIDVTGQPKKITSTLEHPYLTTAKLGHQEHVGDGDSENLKWKSAADIRPGDFIAASVEDYSEHAVDKIDLKTYALVFWGDVVEHDGKYYRASVDRKSNKAKGHNRCLKSAAVNKEVYLDADFGYLVGLYLAEGYVHKYNGAVKGVRYTFNSNDRDLINETVKIAERVFGVDPVVNVNRDGSTNVAIWSAVVGHMFLDLFGTGFDAKRVPKIMRSADRDFLDGLARGIFRGDGCGYANGNVMELSNRELVRDVRNILHQLGVLSYVHDKVTQSGNPSSSIAVPRSNESNDLFLKSIGRGYEKITAEYSEMYAKWVDGRPVYRVRSVEQASPEIVYNLQVAEVNTYVAGGLHVHNCFLLRMEDNMESIGRGINSSLQLSKRGGGVGILLTNIRESGAPIQKVPNTSSGIVPIMKLLEDSFSYANQLG